MEKELFEKKYKNEYNNFDNEKDINTKIIKAIITHNFCFIVGELHCVLSSAFQENVPRYCEFYKERYLCKLLIFKKINKHYKMTNNYI